ncbi:hypothetical protein [Vibrio sp. 10N.239.312.D08]|uniref:hypothetical protein n=1 Tax=Vibrio sp. 10N.239.312.D08 TaxID=3229978 RepID=UPI00354E45E4
MKPTIITKNVPNWKAAQELMNDLEAKGIDHTSFPVPMSGAFNVVWAQLSKDESMTVPLMDWQMFESPDECEEDQKTKYSMDISVGNQTYIDISNADTQEPVFGFILEINKGVPALHLDTFGSDAKLHIHATKEGLILSPDFPSVKFKQAPVSKYSYNEDLSLIVEDTGFGKMPTTIDQKPLGKSRSGVLPFGCDI